MVQHRSVSARESSFPAPLERRMTVRLGQIFPALIDALANGRTFLNDFDDEPIEVSEDLYEVLLAYQHFQQD